MAYSAEESEIISGEIEELLSKNLTEKRVILFLLSLLGGRKMEAYTLFSI